MARPTKTGLDYYPMDTKMDDNMEILEAKHGISGFGVMVKLYQKIYAEGYYINWDEDNKILFSRRANVEIDFVDKVINTAFDREMFSRDKYEKYGILTGRGLQKRFFTACKIGKRKEIEAVKEYLCINGELTGVITELTTVNPGETLVNSELSAQRKEKKSKEKESIVNKDIGEKRKRFIPPTPEEIKAYCLERKNSVDSEKFSDFYKSKNWLVGKSKMVDWKASVRTWEKNDKKNKVTIDDIPDWED